MSASTETQNKTDSFDLSQPRKPLLRIANSHEKATGKPVSAGVLAYEVADTFQILDPGTDESRILQNNAPELLVKIFPELKGLKVAFVLASRNERWADYVNESDPPTFVLTTALFQGANKVQTLDQLAYHLAIAGERYLLEQRFGKNSRFLEQSGTLHSNAVRRLELAGFSATSARQSLLVQASVENMSPTERYVGGFGRHPAGVKALIYVEAAMLGTQEEVGSLCSQPTPVSQVSWISEVGDRLGRSVVDERFRELQIEWEATRTDACPPVNHRARVRAQLDTLGTILNERQTPFSSKDVQSIVEIISGIESEPPLDANANEADIQERSGRLCTISFFLSLTPQPLTEFFDAIVALGTKGDHSACATIYEAAHKVIFEQERPVKPQGKTLQSLEKKLHDYITARTPEKIEAHGTELKSAIKECTAVTDPASQLRELIGWSAFGIPNHKQKGPAPWKQHRNSALQQFALNNSDTTSIDLLIDLGVRDAELLEKIPARALEIYSGENTTRPQPPRIKEADVNDLTSVDSSMISVDDQGDIDPHGIPEGDKLEFFIIEGLLSDLEEFAANPMEGDERTRLSGLVKKLNELEQFSEILRDKVQDGELIVPELALSDPDLFISIYCELTNEAAFQELLVEYFTANVSPGSPDEKSHLKKFFTELSFPRKIGLHRQDHGVVLEPGAPLVEFLVSHAGEVMTKAERFSTLLELGILDTPNDDSVTVISNFFPRPVQTWRDLDSRAKDPLARNCPKIGAYLEEEALMLLKTLPQKLTLPILLSLSKFLNLDNPKFSQFRKVLSPLLQLEGLDKLTLNDAVECCRLASVLSLTSELNKAAPKLCARITKEELSPEKRKGYVERLFFVSTGQALSEPETVGNLCEIWSKALKEMHKGLVSEDSIIAEARVIAENAHPQYVDNWLETAATVCEAQEKDSQFVADQIELAKSKLATFKSSFEENYRKLVEFAMRDPTIRLIVQEILLGPHDDTFFEYYSRQFAEHPLIKPVKDEGSGKSTSEISGDPKQFLESLYSVFWSESDYKRTVRTLELLLPIAGIKTDGDLAGGELGRQNKDVAQLRSVILNYVHPLGSKNSKDVKPFFETWLNQGEGIERLSRLTAAVNAFRDQRLGSKLEASPLLRLSMHDGPVSVYVMQRTERSLSTRPQIRTPLSKVAPRLKTNVNPPRHSTIPTLVRETLPPDVFAKARIHRVLGCGKLWITIGLSIGGAEEVLQIQRPFAEKQIANSERRDKLWLSSLKGVPGAAALARQSSVGVQGCKQELNVRLSPDQFSAAAERMDRKKMTIKLGGVEKIIVSETPQLIAWGFGANGLPYRRMTPLEGVPFVKWYDLEDTDPNIIPFAAAGNFVIGARNIYRAAPERDRHSGNSQVKFAVEQIVLGQLDFGMIDLDMPSLPPGIKQDLGAFLARADILQANSPKLSYGDCLQTVVTQKDALYAESICIAGASLVDNESFLTHEQKLALLLCTSRDAVPDVERGYVDVMKSQSGLMQIRAESDVVQLLV